MLEVLQADPDHFANFLAESAERAQGCSQTKQSLRACAITAFSCLAALLPSPYRDKTVAGMRAGIPVSESVALAAAGIGAGRAGAQSYDLQLRGILRGRSRVS